MFDGEHCGVCGRRMAAIADVCLVSVQHFSDGVFRNFFICDKCADELERWAEDGEFKPKSPWEVDE